MSAGIYHTVPSVNVVPNVSKHMAVNENKIHTINKSLEVSHFYILHSSKLKCLDMDSLVAMKSQA